MHLVFFENAPEVDDHVHVGRPTDLDVELGPENLAFPLLQLPGQVLQILLRFGIEAAV